LIPVDSGAVIIKRQASKTSWAAAQSQEM